MKKNIIATTILTCILIIFAAGCTGERCLNCERVVHKSVLRGINFKFDSAAILENAYPTLNEDVKILKNDPKLKVRIEGHCDIRGSDAYNNKLSLRRARSVYNYFKKYDIDKNRMSIKGYGRSMPLVPNTSEENMYKNRRVEIKIVERIK